MKMAFSVVLSVAHTTMGASIILAGSVVNQVGLTEFQLIERVNSGCQESSRRQHQLRRQRANSVATLLAK